MKSMSVFDFCTFYWNVNLKCVENGILANLDINFKVDYTCISLKNGKAFMFSWCYKGYHNNRERITNEMVSFIIIHNLFVIVASNIFRQIGEFQWITSVSWHLFFFMWSPYFVRFIIYEGAGGFASTTWWMWQVNW